MITPLVLHLPRARAYAVVMAVLLVLFLGRVVGQVLVATMAPSWLPPMARWYSGLMPYRYLLPTQIVLLVMMTAMTIGVGRHSPPFGTLSADDGAWVVWASYVYALGMVARSIRYALAKPDRRGVLIPIVFHFVLAGFLFAYGSAALERSDSNFEIPSAIPPTSCDPSGIPSMSRWTAAAIIG
ncbi:MAG: hypothetical protein ACJ79A_06845 [Gemmatimonadaceae bacterium]